MGVFHSSLCCYKFSTYDKNYISMVEERIKEQEVIIEERDREIKELEDTIKAQTEYLSHTSYSNIV